MVDSFVVGLSLASILLLVGLGLAIIYGSMGVINLAHGEMVMLGAYTAVLGTMHLDLSLYACLPLGFAVGAAFGYLIEVSLIRHMYGRLLETLLATWGLALILQQLVRVNFGLSFLGIEIPGLGPGLQNVPVPDMLRMTLHFGPIDIGFYRLFILIVAVSLLLLTWWILAKTSIGRQLRAVAQDRDVAAFCGIPGERVKRLAFAYGSGLAGVAGVLVSGFKTVSPSMGTEYVVDAFLVVVTGGLGSIFGTAGAAFILGELNAFVSYLWNSVYGQVAMLVAVMIILMVRPQGLFSYKTR